MEAIITQLACLDTWVVSVLTCLEQREKRVGFMMKVHAEPSTSDVSKALNQPAVQIYRFVQIWEPKVLELPSKLIRSNSIEGRRQKALRQPMQATRVDRVPSENSVISAESEWVTKFVGNAPERIRDC